MVRSTNSRRRMPREVGLWPDAMFGGLQRTCLSLREARVCSRPVRHGAASVRRGGVMVCIQPCSFVEVSVAVPAPISPDRPRS